MVVIDVIAVNVHYGSVWALNAHHEFATADCSNRLADGLRNRTMPGEMIEPSTWKIIGEAWSALGPLAGVLVGGYIASRSQRRHWVLDSKRLEFKELFATLTRAYSAVMSVYGSGLHSGQDERRGEEIRLEALNTIRDRVVIGPEVRNMKLAEKWECAVSQFERNNDYVAFATAFQQIMDELRRSADSLIK